MQQTLGKTETLLQTIDRLRNDRYLYSQAVLRIRDKAAVLRPLSPNFAQRYVEEKLEAQKKATGRVRAVVLKARQEGVSTWTAGRFMHQTHLQQGRKALVIADALARAESIFGIYERMWIELPEDLKPEIKSRGNRRHLGFAHDSEISIRPASDKDAGRASTVHYLHASEIAFWPANTQRETWVSVIQAVPDDGSEIIVESTANGAGGLFHELWELTQKEGSGWLGIFLPWWIHEEYDAGPDKPPTEAELDGIATQPDDFEIQALSDGIPFDGERHILPLSRLAWRRRTIIERFGGDPTTLGRDATRDFQQEYPATADEAFLMSGATFFDEDALRRLTMHTREPIKVGRFIETYTQNDPSELPKRTIRMEDARRGFVKIWEAPQKDEHYTIGVDTAEGKLVSTMRVTTDQAAAESGGRDYSSVSIWRLASAERPGALVAVVHGQLASDVLARQIALAGEFYACGGTRNTRKDSALLAVENNHSSGVRVLEYLRDVLKYRRLYWTREINTRTKAQTRTAGWRTDERTRNVLLDNLAELVRKDAVEIPDANTVREMTTFVYSDSGKPEAAEGTHDDRVISLALAAIMTREHRHASTAPMPTGVYGTSQTGTGW